MKNFITIEIVNCGSDEYRQNMRNEREIFLIHFCVFFWNNELLSVAFLNIDHGITTMFHAFRFHFSSDIAGSGTN